MKKVLVAVGQTVRYSILGVCALIFITTFLMVGLALVAPNVAQTIASSPIFDAGVQLLPYFGYAFGIATVAAFVLAPVLFIGVPIAFYLFGGKEAREDIHAALKKAASSTVWWVFMLVFILAAAVIFLAVFKWAFYFIF